MRPINPNMEVSSPGKVLILGGYLILYPQYNGVVLTTDHTVRCTLEAETGAPHGTIHVYSTHFQEWYNFSNWTGEEVKNPFVKYAVETAWSAIIAHSEHVKPCRITINADDAFYGRRKTGLGSSAAVTTALVKVILLWHGIDNIGIIHYTS